MDKKKSDCGCGFGKRIVHRIVRSDKNPAFGKKTRRVVRSKKPVPSNKILYKKVLNQVKAKVKKWPSAYASGQVVRRYKSLGGTYKFGNSNQTKFYATGSQNSLFLTPNIKKCLSIIYGDKVLTRFGKRTIRKTVEPKSKRKTISGLSRWFKEKWVNVCVKKKGKYAPCAKSTKKYPYCRPSIRVNSKTPKTVREIPKSTLKKLCRRKTNAKRMKNV
jgi:hypothetical protein